MALTNKNNLPETIVEAMRVDTHRMIGDISVTQLIDAPQIRILNKIHKPDSDASDRVWALLGTAIHEVLERANQKNVRIRSLEHTVGIMEEHAKELVKGGQPDKSNEVQRASKYINDYKNTYYPNEKSRYISEVTRVQTINGMVVSGTPDLYDIQSETLYDYKVCSVQAYIQPESRKKWNAQVNTYAWMLRKDGLRVKFIKIICIFRDWSKHKAHITRDYPPASVVEIPVEIVDDTTMQKYLDQRVFLHQQAEAGNIADCTGKERWSSATTYAIMTPGAKRAIRVFPDEKLADKFILDEGHKYTNVFKDVREGTDTRCDSYCPVRDYCPQRKRKVEQKQQVQQ